MSVKKIKELKTFASYSESPLKVEGLLGFQRKSYEEFLEKGLQSLFMEFFPIVDNSGVKFTINYISYKIEEPKMTPEEARCRLIDYSAQLKVNLELVNSSGPVTTRQIEEVIFGEVPIMTEQNSFIINGKERTVISQLVRSDGVRFCSEKKPRGQRSFVAEIKPKKGYGAWVVFETDSAGRLYVRFDQSSRKVPATTFIRLFGPKTKEDVLKLFSDDEKTAKVIEKTMGVDNAETMDDVLVAMYKVFRSGDPSSPQKAKELIDSKFSKDTYDISVIGRINLNRRSKRPTTGAAISNRSLQLEDLVFMIKEMTRLTNDFETNGDDIDNLAVRRVRPVGELFAEHLRNGFVRMCKNSRDRMMTTQGDQLKTPTNILNLRIFNTTMQSFFSTNQLSQTLKQKNVLDEMEHLRTLSALGGGGLTREHAGVAVRNVHRSHYGRICPVHTPEGQTVGLVLHFAMYAQINEHGLLEVPYIKIENGKLTDEMIYLTADAEESLKITHNGSIDPKTNEIKDDEVIARYKGDTIMAKKEELDAIDISTAQIFSIATALIPFVCHNIVARALFGSTMQRQAIACANPEAPLVSTGYEAPLVRATGRVILAKGSGTVTYVDAKRITITGKDGETTYHLKTFNLTNEPYFPMHQRPNISLGQKVKKNDVIADVASSDDGQLALGKNVRVAYCCYEGLNYEDSIIVSQRIVERDVFTSIEVEELPVNIRETKLGNEVMTADIPNVSEHRLRNLDASGVVRVGSDVSPGDVLVGKLTPKGESQPSPEERLLQSIFGEKAKDVKETSLKVPQGKKGRVINVEIRDRGDQYSLEAGVIQQVRITIAEIRTIQEGDKLANRHGNKGIISRVLPVEDMPFTSDGEPIDVIITPIGVPSRQNFGQIMELHLGLAAHTLGYQAVIPPLTSITEEELKKELVAAGYPESGKVELHNGKTGDKMEADVAIGYMYVMKLSHMVEDKIHARSVGAYSLIPQQPLGGRARGGGQRLGEMEVWALLGHGAAYTLRELLTIKSDDIFGRSSAYSSIIKGRPIQHNNTPAAFNVLLHFLRGLAVDVRLEESIEKK